MRIAAFGLHLPSQTWNRKTDDFFTIKRFTKKKVNPAQDIHPYLRGQDITPRESWHHVSLPSLVLFCLFVYCLFIDLWFYLFTYYFRNIAQNGSGTLCICMHDPLIATYKWRMYHCTSKEIQQYKYSSAKKKQFCVSHKVLLFSTFHKLVITFKSKVRP